MRAETKVELHGHEIARPWLKAINSHSITRSAESSPALAIEERKVLSIVRSCFNRKAAEITCRGEELKPSRCGSRLVTVLLLSGSGLWIAIRGATIDARDEQALQEPQRLTRMGDQVEILHGHIQTSLSQRRGHDFYATR